MRSLQMSPWPVTGAEREALPAKYSGWWLGSQDMNDVELPPEARIKELFYDLLSVEGELVILSRGRNHLIVGIPIGTRPAQRLPFEKALGEEST